MSIHYSLKSSDQNSIIKSIFLGKTFWEDPDDPDLCWIIRPKPSAQVRMIRPSPESSGSHGTPASQNLLVISRWSGPCSDHPDMTLRLYKGLAAGTTLTSILFYPPPPSFLLNSTWQFGISTKDSSISLVSLILYVSEDPDPFRTLRFARELQRYFSFKILSPRSLNVGSSRGFPPVNHLIYLSRGHA